jgi:hypothetical protein
MDTFNKIEGSLARMYNGAPHLPKPGRLWLAKNMWWICLVALILLLSALFVIIPLIVTAVALSPTVDGGFPDVPYYQQSMGMTWLALMLIGICYTFTAVLLALASGPLKMMHKLGWNLALYAAIVSFTLTLAGSLVDLSYTGLVVAVVGGWVGGYLLFETREHFKPHLASSKK